MARMSKPGTKLGRKRNAPVKQLKGPVTKDNLGRVKAKKGLDPKTPKPKGPVGATTGQAPEKGQGDWRGWTAPQKPRRPGGVRSYQR